jgi:hypothetical protein
MRCRIATTLTPLIPCRAIRQGNIEFAKPILSIAFGRRTAIERSEREFTATPAAQCKSNRVSGRSFRKTGISQRTAGDFRRFQPLIGQIRSLETTCRIAKARHWQAFQRLLEANSHPAALPGWRRSADRTSLWANSLLTGNFTGNFAILAV